MPEAKMINLQSLLSLLSPFCAATEDFSSESSVTVSCILPTLHQLRCMLQPDDADSPEIAAIRSAMCSNLGVRYSDGGVEMTLYAACFLDPRLKVWIQICD